MIEARDLKKSFSSSRNQERIVFKNLNFQLQPHETTSFLGPSGCGKSTLLRMIAGLESISHGQLLVQERHPGFVFQEPRLLPWRTALENVLLPLELTGTRLTEQTTGQAKAQLDKVQLGSSLHLFPHQLSGGMKMRVSVARSLIHSPKLLLLDEPFSALDEQTRLSLQKEIVNLTVTENLTTVFVTHSISEASAVSDRIIIFNRQGNIVVDERSPVPNSRKSADYLASSEHFHFSKRLSELFQQHSGVKS